jgi:hypothetical protein
MSDTAPSDQTQTVYTINTDNIRNTSAPPKSRGGKTVRDKRKDRVESLLTKIGAGVYAADKFDGLCILARVSDAADSLADLAETDKNVAKMIDNLTVAGGYVAVISVLLSMIAPIVARHGLLPQNLAMPVIAVTAPSEAQAILGQMMAAQAERMAQNANPDS